MVSCAFSSIDSPTEFKTCNSACLARLNVNNLTKNYTKLARYLIKLSGLNKRSSGAGLFESDGHPVSSDPSGQSGLESHTCHAGMQASEINEH